LTDLFTATGTQDKGEKLQKTKTMVHNSYSY